MQFVVSRYNESTKWLRIFKNVVLYNKGGPIEEPCIVLPNVGREAHTYLYHIITNYDNLADHTCFLQAFPFDHSMYLLPRIYNYEGEAFYTLSDSDYKCKLSGCIFHEGLPLREHYETLFEDTAFNLEDEPFIFGSGAQFIVSRERIHSRSKAFYEKALKLVDGSRDAIGAWTLERLWVFIFGHPEIKERD